MSLVGLAVASFTSRRAFALGGYAALMLIPDVSSAAALVEGAGLDRHVQLIELGRLPIAATRALYPGSQRPGARAVAGWMWWAACGVVMTISVHLPVVALPEGRRLTLVFAGVSKWYGDTVALAEVSFELGAGRDRPARPQRRRQVDGARALRRLRRSEHRAPSGCSGSTRGAKPEVYRRIGIVHDRDGLWPFLTARELVELMAGLRDVPDPARGRGRGARERRVSRTPPSGASAASRRACASA